MGNCCKGEEGAEVVISGQTTKKPAPRQNRAERGFDYQKGQDEIIDQILDDREILGRKGEEKIELVEKI